MAKYPAHFLSHVVEHRRRRLAAPAPGTPGDRPLPPKPDEMAWRDYLIMLLHVGSELEHGLMVQYLYAAYSLGGENLSPKDQAKVRQWQNLILTVAREEMGHLLTVQNLLCFVGGPVSFNREEFPWDTPFYPFPFMLEPLCRESLAAYVFAEMPGNFDTLEKLYANSRPGTRARYFEQVDIPFIEATVRKWVGTNDSHPVGEVYGLITDIISDPNLIPDSVFRPDSYTQQASWDDWGRSYAARPTLPDGSSPRQDPTKAHIIIEPVATRTDALRALKEISNQGEAADVKPKAHPKKGANKEVPEEPSHFERFVKLLQEFEKRPVSRHWNPVRNVPRNPTTTLDSRTDPRRPAFARTPITAPASLRWANLFNVRYRILLSYLTHTFRLARIVDPGQPNTRGALMARIFGEMYNLKTIAGILVRMPLTEKPNDPRRAGPPFQMPYSMELPLDEIDSWQIHRDIAMNSRELCAELLNSAPSDLAGTPPEGKDYLLALRSLDQHSIAWMDAILARLRKNGGKHA
jgi:hypothetical protein